jgi:hypothetical protein
LQHILNDFDLKAAQDEIKEVKYKEEAELFINVIIESYRLCDRISKESNEIVTVEKGLCNNCRYNVTEKVCSKIIHPLSVRVKEDLYRYGKALAWYLGDAEVEIRHIKVLAPFMIWHRSSLSKIFKKELSESRFESSIFTLNMELDSTKELINNISQEFEGLLPFLIKFDKIKKGKLTLAEFQDFVKDIKDDRNNFLITKKVIVPILEQSYIPIYSEIVSYNIKIESTNNLPELNILKQELSNRYDIPNRQFLADLIEKKRRRIGAESLPKFTLKLPFDTFEDIVGKECIELNAIIQSKFNGNFNPTFLKTESISDVGESEYSLTMERLNEGSGKNSLRFVYQGKEDHPVYSFLKKNNAG